MGCFKRVKAGREEASTYKITKRHNILLFSKNIAAKNANPNPVIAAWRPKRRASKSNHWFTIRAGIIHKNPTVNNFLLSLNFRISEIAPKKNITELLFCKSGITAFLISLINVKNEWMVGVKAIPWPNKYLYIPFWKDIFKAFAIKKLFNKPARMTAIITAGRVIKIFSFLKKYITDIKNGNHSMTRGWVRNDKAKNIQPAKRVILECSSSFPYFAKKILILEKNLYMLTQSWLRRSLSSTME